MQKNYYYFVSGLPEISADDTKLLLTPLMLFHAAREQLDKADLNLLSLLLLPNDMTNAIGILHDKNNWSDESTVLREKWEEVIKSLKRKDEPAYINKNVFADKLPVFILEYLSLELQKLELPEYSLMLRDLFSLFYDWIELNCDGFVKDWYRFDSEMKNIITALNCRKHGLPLQNQLIGNSYLTSKLLKSNASDFGLGNEFPLFEAVSRVNDNPDIIGKEKGFDVIRWKWLENRTFFDYFSLPRILAYFLKSRIIYRWINLSQSVGEKRFHQVLHELETSFVFPEEFALKR